MLHQNLWKYLKMKYLPFFFDMAVTNTWSDTDNKNSTPTSGETTRFVCRRRNELSSGRHMRTTEPARLGRGTGLTRASHVLITWARTNMMRRLRMLTWHQPFNLKNWRKKTNRKLDGDTEKWCEIKKQKTKVTRSHSLFKWQHGAWHKKTL